MDEWNAIDLHMHTVSGFTRDKSKDVVTFTYLDFVKVLKKYNMKLMAVTNHNYINFANYILMKYLGKECETNILLGVELDSNLSIGTHIHIAVIFNTFFNDNFEVSHIINNLTENKFENEEEILYSNDEIISLLKKKYDLIMIPHGNKDKGIFKNASYDQIKEALKKISEGFIRIFDSPSDWKLSKIKGFLNEIGEDNLDNFGGVLFSDNRDWTQYEKNYRNFYMNAEPTFKGLIHSTSNPLDRFKPYNEIRKNSNFISAIKIKNLNPNGKITDCKIKLSSGYNCIIGKSGSGKSLLLHIIKKNLTRNNANSDKYAFINDTQIEIYNENEEKLSPDSINVSIGENLFDKIISATTTNDYNDYYKIIALLNPEFQKRKKFTDFVDNYNDKLLIYYNLHTEINNDLETLQIKLIEYRTKILDLEKLIKVKVFDVSNLSSKQLTYTDNSISIFKSYDVDIKELHDKVALYKGKYKDQIQEQITELNKILGLALNEIQQIKVQENLENKKIDIINNAINYINGNKSAQSQTKAKLQTDIPNLREQITSLVLNTYINKVKFSNINLSININEIDSKNIISKDKSVEVEENISMNDITHLSEKENVLFKTFKYKKLLSDNIYNMTLMDGAKKLINKYIEVGIINENSHELIDSFAPKVNIFFDKQNINELNPGDIAKKYIQIYFKDQLVNGKNNVVLFDQIENDVDKTFINNVIKELIEGTKGKVQLIIVTHDPIVAVNADPNRYIQSIKENNKITYRDFVAESSENDELNTIACTVDGSIQVIHDRYEIYEGDKLHGN
jgi:ABC-type lipoprotein export system ATPase subunit